MSNNNSTEMDVDDDFEWDVDGDMNERAGTPIELIEAAAEANEDLLPIKSKVRYQKAYNEYMKWKETKKATSNSERVVLSYFREMAKSSKKPTTMWARFSMLKSTLKLFDKVDIENYASVSALLKRKSYGYVPKKAKTFTESEMQNFLDNAPDVAWLDVKAASAFGILGCCRCHELPTIRMEDIKRYDDMYYVTVPAVNTKTNIKNSFAIAGPLLDIVRRYENLRPNHVTSDRFFLNFQKGKCTTQTIGKNKFYKMPQRIAQFLNLPDPVLYTGHSIRRTSTTIYANTGATIEALKRHTKHKSTKICESYIDESEAYKMKTANAIVSSLGCASTSSIAFQNSNSCSSSSGLPLVDCHQKVAQRSATSSVDDFVAMDPVIPSMNVGKGSDERGKTSSNVSTSIHTDSFDAIAPVAIETEDIACDVEPDVNMNSQVSRQTFMAQMERFSFYKCDKLTINFQPQFHQK